MKLHARIAAVCLAAALAAGFVAPTATAQSRAGERRAASAPTLVAPPGPVVALRWFVLKGTVAPAAAGTTVVLQKKVRNERWVDEARLRTTPKGTFRYRDRPHVAGVRTYRVVVPAAAGIGRGVSDPITITVYKWQSLVRIPVRRSTDTWPNRTGGSIDGVLYAPVFEGVFSANATEGFSDWNLGRKCLSLRATVGNGDQGDTGSAATVTLAGDATTLVSRTFGLTESETGTYDLTGVFRLTFSWTAPEGGAQAMLAEPQVLCAF